MRVPSRILASVKKVCESSTFKKISSRTERHFSGSKKQNGFPFIKFTALALLGGTVLYFAYDSITTAQEREAVAKYYADNGYSAERKPRVVVLGTGWAAMSLLQTLKSEHFDVVVVSPRNYFLFTPLLAGSTVGTVESRSIIHPIRRQLSPSVTYFEAACTDIDVVNKVVRCTDMSPVPGSQEIFDVPYDHLVVAVGSVPNTFNTPGVYDNCFFVKDITDAREIRARIMDSFETANIPTQTEEERHRLLRFLIVGGGPTGVETAAEIHDFVTEDLSKYFPNLMPYYKISVIQSSDHILNTFDAQLSKYAEQRFSRNKIDVRVRTRVAEVKPPTQGVVIREKVSVPVETKNDKGEIVTTMKQEIRESAVPYGLCIWATGIQPAAIVNTLVNHIEAAAAQKADQSKKTDTSNPVIAPGTIASETQQQKGRSVQRNRKALLTDDYLRVKGAEDNIFAAGDCCTVDRAKLVDNLVELFKEADLNGDGVLSMTELEQLVNNSIKRYPQLLNYRHGLLKLFNEYDADKNGALSIDEFERLLNYVDSKTTAYPATAQVASQQGVYIAKALNNIVTGKKLEDQHSFSYSHFASLAYVGGYRAVTDMSKGTNVTGMASWWVWRSVYLSKQVTLRNKVLVSFDWVKSFLFGRDISRY